MPCEPQRETVGRQVIRRSRIYQVAKLIWELYERGLIMHHRVPQLERDSRLENEPERRVLTEAHRIHYDREHLVSKCWQVNTSPQSLATA